MDGKAVSGVVVTYRPDADVIVNLEQLRPQMQHLIVVDNGSTEEELAPLRSASVAMGFELIENGENLGIATALNIGIERADELQTYWVFLFDQDSMVTDGFAQTMISNFEAIANERRLGLLVPRYIDKRLGTPMLAIYEPDGRVETAMTSGSLVPMTIYRKHGLFIDELFIDGVDHEYSLRLRDLGYTIEECFDAVLLHSPGNPSSHSVRMRAKAFLASNYSPIRRYYQERNKIWLVRRYWRRFPFFSRRQYRVSSKDLIKIVLFEDDKLRKMRFFFLGMWHGLIGKTGKYPGHWTKPKQS